MFLLLLTLTLLILLLMMSLSISVSYSAYRPSVVGSATNLNPTFRLNW